MRDDNASARQRCVILPCGPEAWAAAAAASYSSTVFWGKQHRDLGRTAPRLRTNGTASRGERRHAARLDVRQRLWKLLQHVVPWCLWGASASKHMSSGRGSASPAGAGYILGTACIRGSRFHPAADTVLVGLMTSRGCCHQRCLPRKRYTEHRSDGIVAADPTNAVFCGNSSLAWDRKHLCLT